MKFKKSKSTIRANDERAFEDRSNRHQRSADVSGIIEEEYGKYWIRAGVLSGNCVARAFPKPPAKTQAMIAESGGDTLALAIKALKKNLGERATRRNDERRLDEKTGTYIPSESEFFEALRQIRLSSMQVAMLKVHSAAGNGGLTIGQLSKVAGYESREATIKNFKKLGILIAQYLEIEIPETENTQSAWETKVLAFSVVASEDTPAIWVMHQELRSAVRNVL